MLYSQSGIALPVVLIFLIVMSMMGVVAIRNVTLEEKIAGNLRSHQLAFEAAEQVLRYCESEAAKKRVYPGDTPRKDRPPQLAAGPIVEGKNSGKHYWEVEGSWTDQAVSFPLPKYLPVSHDLALRPSCIIEQLTHVSDYEFELHPRELMRTFRITARGVGTNPNVAVFLQSYYGRYEPETYKTSE
ncbi:PilX N-terminal domain-containing pilus assembly protein [Glaciimonas sp. PCH181]|uniref:pilus assembly PilX family protein n=1 Tax=Glaciimonas sp. PCH181 TaxID=2133943 RepID=UPI001374EDBA|nr:PilX N-terminal domain-containing pilus assembly protein [Glaciimonas sp. PCH181]